jgi:hypothetical protein
LDEFLEAMSEYLDAESSPVVDPDFSFIERLEAARQRKEAAIAAIVAHHKHKRIVSTVSRG